MSTKPKHSTGHTNAPNNSLALNPQPGATVGTPSCNYDASRIFRFEAYARKLRERAAVAG